MAGSITACPSCKKINKGDGRYCIYCGSILKPVYCSSCGTINPDDLTQCLECGNQIPRLAGLRWGPIVNVLQPTSAMNNEIPQAPRDQQVEGEFQEVEDQGESGLFSKLKRRFGRKQSNDG